jgi:hypothetical protein
MQKLFEDFLCIFNQVHGCGLCSLHAHTFRGREYCRISTISGHSLQRSLSENFCVCAITCSALLLIGNILSVLDIKIFVLVMLNVLMSKAVLISL